MCSVHAAMCSRCGQRTSALSIRDQRYCIRDQLSIGDQRGSNSRPPPPLLPPPKPRSPTDRVPPPSHHTHPDQIQGPSSRSINAHDSVQVLPPFGHAHHLPSSSNMVCKAIRSGRPIHQAGPRSPRSHRPCICGPSACSKLSVTSSDHTSRGHPGGRFARRCAASAPGRFIACATRSRFSANESKRGCMDQESRMGWIDG